MYDLQSIFSALDVRFWSSGKNCSPGWVNIQCIFCSDHSNHLGVSLETGTFHCWKCDSVGSLPELIYEISNMEKGQIYRFLAEHRSEGERKITSPTTPRVGLSTPSCFHRLQKVHKDYLRSRGFDPKEIVEKYRVRAIHFAGKYKYRLLVPIVFNGEEVNFTAMDITGESDRKYIHCPNDQALLDMKSVLYNFDTVKDRVIVCEGVTDVWRMGDGAVATMGTQFTERQLKLLTERVGIAFVLYDSDATKKGERLAYQLSGIINRVENIILPKGDPADLSPAMVRKIRRWVWGS